MIKIFQCACATEGLVVYYDEEDKDVEIAFWAYGNKHKNGKLGLKERLRWCWKTLTTGQPYTDMVILSKEEAGKFADYIIDLISEG